MSEQKIRSTFKCPGKIFLLGEYACLAGGPALIKTILPSFELRVSVAKSEKGHMPSIAPSSPAGVYLLQRAKDLQGYDLEFVDPYLEKYQTPIGVGSSTAQFLLSVLVENEISGNQTSLEELLSTYWKIIGESQGLRPSGVDLAAQFLALGHGPITQFIHYREGQLSHHKKIGEELSPEHSFYLVFTGRKVKTHDHLLALKARGFPGQFEKMTNQLSQLTESGLLAFDKKNASMFGELMNRYQAFLDENQISSAEFREMISMIREFPGVIGVKGSGAQGGDCILAYVENKKAAEFERLASARFQFLIKV